MTSSEPKANHQGKLSLHQPTPAQAEGFLHMGAPSLPTEPGVSQAKQSEARYLKIFSLVVFASRSGPGAWLGGIQWRRCTEQWVAWKPSHSSASHSILRKSTVPSAVAAASNTDVQARTLLIFFAATVPASCSGRQAASAVSRQKCDYWLGPQITGSET
jgi:hypothetical protein